MRRFQFKHAFGLSLFSLLPAALAVFRGMKTRTWMSLSRAAKWTPDEQAKVVKAIPRDAETIELFKKFAGTGPLPSRK